MRNAFFAGIRGPEPIPEAGRGDGGGAGEEQTREIKVVGNREAGRVKGLKNLGNTCFFNAVLQNLVNTAPLRDTLLARGREGLAGEGDVTRALRAVMAAVWGSSASAALVPKELLDAVAKAEPRFAGYQQHDSHELFQTLLEAVRREESARIKVPRLSTSSCPVFEPVYGGQMLSCVTCAGCKRRSTNLESFNDLSIDIPPASWLLGAQKPRAAAHAAGQCHISANGQGGERGDVPTLEQRKEGVGKEEEHGQGGEEHPLKVRSRATLPRASLNAMAPPLGGTVGFPGLGLGAVAPTVADSLDYYTCEEVLEGEESSWRCDACGHDGAVKQVRVRRARGREGEKGEERRAREREGVKGGVRVRVREGERRENRLVGWHT